VIRTWVEEDVGRVHLDDPDRRNALSKELSDAIAEAVTSLQGSVGAILLTAEPPVFCSGGVLDDLIAPRFPLAASYAGMQALAACPVPTICVVDGPAIGAGVNLPLACDIVITGPKARFDPRFLDVGIHPGGGHLARLRDRVGRQGAVAMSLCGDSLSGEEAAAAGFAWRYAADPMALAMRFAWRAAHRDRELVVRAKQSLDADGDPYEVELAAQQWSVDRPGFKEGVEKLRDSLKKR
jgi:enoyl-CoA hydratase